MATNIRETYSAFPRWSQPLWTLLTGKPATGEQPLLIPSGWLYLAVSLSVFIAGTLGSYKLVSAGFGVQLLGLLPTMALTVLGSRLLILTIAHQCAHHRFCYSKRLNQLVHDVLTTIICSQNYDAYRYDHFHVHHGLKTFGTFEDPVLSFIKQLGFADHLSRAQLWRKLWLTCISPSFHGTYLGNRLRHNIFGGRIIRRCFTVVWWLGLSTLLVLRPHLIVPVLVAYAIPVLILYNISAFLELICEHVWMRPLTAPPGRQRITDLSWGRFCGDAVPVGQDHYPWIRWWLRTLFYHLPCRFLVLAGDAPQHDFHHLAPSSRRWTVSAYERRDLIEAGKMEDREVWGLFEAIDVVFGHFSTAPEYKSALSYLTANSQPRRTGAHSDKPSTLPGKGTVIIGGTESDTHVVSLYLAALLLAEHGYHVINRTCQNTTVDLMAPPSERLEVLAYVICNQNGHALEDLRDLALHQPNSVPVILGGHYTLGCHNKLSQENQLKALGISFFADSLDDLITLLSQISAQKTQRNDSSQPPIETLHIAA